MFSACTSTMGRIRPADTSDQARRAAKMEGMSEAETTEQIPLPPVSFTFLVISLRAQAEMQMGLMQYGDEEASKPDLRLARHTLEIMAMLLEKTKGNLTLEEQRLLENSLTELRFRFVQTSDELAKTAPPA